MSVDICGGFVGFRNHVNGMAGALFVADGAAGAFVEVETVALARSEFDDGFFRAGPETAIAFEAVATAEASFGLISGFLFCQPFDDFIEAADGDPRHEPVLFLQRSFGLIPHVQLAETGGGGFLRLGIDFALEPGIDVA